MHFETVNQSKKVMGGSIASILFISIILLWPLFTNAQNLVDSSSDKSNVETEFSTVTITGFGNALAASYERLQRGVSAFNANSQLAPLAVLKFRVSESEKNNIPLALRLELDDGHWLPIEVDVEGYFVLPEITGPQVKTAQIVANRKNGIAKIEPNTTSPGLAVGTSRLGDLRLTCSVRWAIYGEDAPLALRAMTALTDGPCNNRLIRMYVMPRAGEKTKKIFLQEGNRKLELVEDGIRRGFITPLHDQSWSNEARSVSEFNPE